MIRTLFLILLLLGSSMIVVGQKCTLLVNGKLIDSVTKEAIPFAAIVNKESGQGCVSEPDGSFHFHDRCAGIQTLIISHISYLPDTFIVSITHDTLLTIELVAKAEWLESVTIEEDYHDHDKRYIGGSIINKSISQQSNKNLADMLESIEGVNVLKTGPGISKPMIHGNYGNRVTTINRGITQAGQQWGNDHGLEIDAFGASKIKVIKGAGVLAYDGNSIGNIVLVDSEVISPDSNLHGEVNSIFQSNGLGITLNGLLEMTNKWAAWRVIGTYKKMGDNAAPNYYLTNTGKEELNFSLQLNRSFFKKWYNEIYASTYNTDIGILRGSHISNITDLEEAIERDVPFFTEDTFSYNIGPPRQQVNHQFFKYETKYFTQPYSFFSFKYGFQWDQRYEYDVRRGDRSDIPSLSLNLITNAIDAAYVHHFRSGFTLSSGYQYNYQDNTNDPETGILPLIPDYLSWSNSLYSVLEKDRNQWGFDIGLRLNNRKFNVVTFTKDLPRQIVRYSNDYANFALAGSMKYVWRSAWTAKLNVNFAQRSPEINELYSNGLHQGVAAFEEGNPNLNVENNFKTLLSIDWDGNEQLHFQFVSYIQSVDNYIFLEPTGEFILTIRGAYPLYRYNQTQAMIYGIDFSMDYEFNPFFDIQFKYAGVRGENLSENTTLINMPADQLKLNLNYRLKDGQKWGASQLSLKNSYTLKQWRVSEYQDFVAPPPAYFLLGIQGSTTRYFKSTSLRFSLRIENLLNTTYRDYLNRMRYFADDLGINVQVGAQFLF